MIIINSVSDITSHFNMVVSELEASNISIDVKISKDFTSALEWGYIEQKCINVRLIQFYKEVIEGIKDMTFEQCKDCFNRIKENQVSSLVGIDFYQNTTIKIREANFYQTSIIKVSEILKSM